MDVRRGIRRRLDSARRRVAHWVSPGVQTTDVRGVRITLAVENDIEAFRALTYADKEPETLDWLDEWIHPHEVLFDVGANIGLYSLYAEKRGAMVHAFEPEALNFARLNTNVVLNSAHGVTTSSLAIGGGMRMDTLYSSKFMSGAALHSLGASVDQNGRSFVPVHRQGTLVVSVDELCGSFGLPVPQHMKVDVDGGENDVIRGARRTMQDPAFRSLLVEISGVDDSILGMMDGFSCVARSDPSLVNPSCPGVNYIFVKNSAR